MAASSDPVEELEAALAASPGVPHTGAVRLRLRLSAPPAAPPVETGTVVAEEGGEQPQQQPQEQQPPQQSPEQKQHKRKRTTLSEGRERRVVKRNVLYGEVQELSEEFQRCLGIVESLLRTDDMQPFYEPVDPVALGLPTYFDVVKTPMDLGTVRANLLGGRYGSSRAFADDMRLMFRNALAFNPAGSFVHDVAATYLRHFEAAYESQVAAYVRTQVRRSTGAAAVRLHSRLLRAVTAPPAKRPARSPAAPPAADAAATEDQDDENIGGERRRLAVILRNFPEAHAAALLRRCRAGHLAPRAHSVPALVAAVDTLDAPALHSLSEAITAALTEPPASPKDEKKKQEEVQRKEEQRKEEPQPPQPREEEEEEEETPAVSPFMQRLVSPGMADGGNSAAGGGAQPRILCCESAGTTGAAERIVMRPEMRTTWSMLAARTPPPTATTPPAATTGTTGTGTAEGDGGEGESDAWAQFRAQTVLREQREQLRAKSLEERRAMLAAAERERAAHLARLQAEARAAREAQQAAEHERLEREREALRQRVAEAAEPDADADDRETEMYAALERDARASSSLLQLDDSLLLDDLQPPPSSSSS